ncbi:hypothetical protein [Actinocrispum wychmicini]|uniref:hypothetical protein n=1 Tax=Actinocrispum wychmicini TaxID=1213861 RepID=UPI001044448F|nr:hypothetical protein [Actinocrispum wychmicini]
MATEAGLAPCLADYDTARDHCQAALALHRNHRSSGGMTHTLDSLGFIEHQTGNHRRGIGHYHEALILYRNLGAAYEVADTLDRMGHSHASHPRPHRRSHARTTATQRRDHGARARRLVDRPTSPAPGTGTDNATDNGLVDPRFHRKLTGGYAYSRLEKSPSTRMVK